MLGGGSGKQQGCFSPDAAASKANLTCDETLCWLEFACWTVLLLVPMLCWINGPAVSGDQLVVRTALVVLAAAEAISLRIINRRRKRRSSPATETNTRDSGESRTT